MLQSQVQTSEALLQDLQKSFSQSQNAVQSRLVGDAFAGTFREDVCDSDASKKRMLSSQKAWIFLLFTFSDQQLVDQLLLQYQPDRLRGLACFHRKCSTVFFQDCC